MNDEFKGFVLSLVDHQRVELASTQNRLIENLQYDLDRSRATLCAIRDGIAALYSGEFVPSERSVKSALYPNSELIDEYVQEITREKR